MYIECGEVANGGIKRYLHPMGCYCNMFLVNVVKFGIKQDMLEIIYWFTCRERIHLMENYFLFPINIIANSRFIKYNRREINDVTVI